jgi:putative ABC transport system permease protein
MSWWLLAWRMLAYRPAVALLNLVTLALGLAALVMVLSVSGQVSAHVDRDLRGVDLVIGVKGSPLQLILAGVFHVDQPAGNIPAGLEQTIAALPGVARVVPLALGDSYRGQRIVGTRLAYLEAAEARFAQGAPWTAPMQVVLGARAARVTGLTLGARFAGQHGLGEGGETHADQPFEVVGILAPTGGAIDRLILTDIASVWQVHEHETALDDDDRAELVAAREASLLHVAYSSPLAAVTLPRTLNARPDLQAAVPALEMARLWRMMGIGSTVIGAVGAGLLALAGLSIFAALYAAVQDRIADLALLRLVGASRARLVQVILLQASVLAAGALLLGFAVGHAGVALLGEALAAEGGLPLSGAWFSADEAWAAGAALATAWVAALAPAMKACRVPVDHLLAG